MKEILKQIHASRPGSIKGIVGHSLLLKGDPQAFFDDFLEEPFENQKAYKYTSFQFILEHSEQFNFQVNAILEGDYSDKHLWEVFRIVVGEIESEVKQYAQRQRKVS